VSTFRWVAVVAVAVVAQATAACGSPEPGLPTGRLLISDGANRAAVEVEIAETEEARRTGLMHRTKLDASSGMVFLFDQPTRAGFWMKDTLIPLTIAFWDDQGHVIGVYDMDPCPADPCRLYGPGFPYVGAVEVNRDFFDEARIGSGALVRLERDGA